MKKVLLSGIKPTGKPHIGNYFGAMRQWIELQNGGLYDAYIMVADYHALNFIQSAHEMRTLTQELVMNFLSIGLDPEKTVLFKQSDISAHTEAAWIFDTITTMPYLMRGHAFKDAETKNSDISVGTFNYPMLMAADILLYSPELVPVGQDQKQHVEYARDTALKFNRIYGETFSLPEPMILDDVAVIPGTDGRKMSKSYDNTIPLFSTRDEIQKLVMGIVTDSGGVRPENVYAIHKLLKPEMELAPLYAEYEGKYKPLKDALIEDLDAFIAPIRTKREGLMKDPEIVNRVLDAARERASSVANAKLVEMKKKIGVM